MLHKPDNDNNLISKFVNNSAPLVLKTHTAVIVSRNKILTIGSHLGRRNLVIFRVLQLIVLKMLSVLSFRKVQKAFKMNS